MTHLPSPRAVKVVPACKVPPDYLDPVETGGGLESRVQKVNQAQSERREDRDVMALM